MDITERLFKEASYEAQFKGADKWLTSSNKRIHDTVIDAHNEIVSLRADLEVARHNCECAERQVAALTKERDAALALFHSQEDEAVAERNLRLASQADAKLSGAAQMLRSNVPSDRLAEDKQEG